MSPWEPASDFQRAVLAVPGDVEEEFYPGGRGSGKTNVLEVKAVLHCLEHPGANVGWYRKNLTDAEDLITELDQMCTSCGARSKSYGPSRKRWTFPNGSGLTVMYLNKDNDATQGQGSGKTMIVFDEVGKYADPKLIDKLRGSLRSGRGIPCKMILAANPGGPGHTWLKRRYMHAPPYRPFDMRLTPDSIPIRALWIPSYLDDNPHIDAARYKSQLSAIGNQHLREAWINNNWDINAGAYWGEIFNTDKHVIRPRPIPQNWRRLRCMDWGFGAPYSIGWWAVDESGNLILTDEIYGVADDGVEGLRQPADVVARIMASREEQNGDARVRWSDSVADIPGEIGAGTSVLAEFARHGIRWRQNPKGQVENYRIATLQEITLRLNNTANGKPNGMMFFDTCGSAIEQVQAIPIDEDHPEDVDKEAPDHIIDMIKMAVQYKRLAAKDLATYKQIEQNRIDLPHADEIRRIKIMTGDTDKGPGTGFDSIFSENY